MNVRHLAELAGLLSAHALQILKFPFPASQAGFEEFEAVSRKRNDAWFTRMDSLKSGAHCWSTLYAPDEDCRCPLIEEILTAELLTRVVCGLLTAQAQQSGDNARFRMAAALFHDCQEARRLALKQMVEMADGEIPAVRRLDRHRRLVERWTDIFLGPLHCLVSVSYLVFDESRAREFGQAMLPHLASPAGSGLFTAGLRVAFPQSLQGVPAHAGLHREAAAAVLQMLPSEIFENDGSLLPLRTVRTRQISSHEDRAPAKLASPPKPKHTPILAKTPSSKLAFHKLRRPR